MNDRVWGSTPIPELPPYRRVLVMVDGSSAGESAARSAAAIARYSGASLHVAGWSSPMSAGGAPLDRLDVVSLVTRGRNAAMAMYVTALTERLRQRSPCEPGGSLLMHGSSSEAPAALVRHVDADLLVSTTQSGGALSRERFGEAVAAVTRRAGIPVLVVPPRALGNVCDAPVFVLSGAPADRNRQTLQQALRFAGLRGAPVTTAQDARAGTMAATGTYGPGRRPDALLQKPRRGGGADRASRVVVASALDPCVLPWIRRVGDGPVERRDALLVSPTS